MVVGVGEAVGDEVGDGLGDVGDGDAVVGDGDGVVGDGDGVVVLPHEGAAEVVAGGEEQARAEEVAFAQIAAGTWDRSWVAAALTEVRTGAEAAS